MKPVTDPALLSLLNSDQGFGEHFSGPVSDPATLAALNGQPTPHDDFGIPQVNGDFNNRIRDMVVAANRAVAGYGHGVQSLANGIGQVGLHVGEKIGSATPEEVRNFDQRVTDEDQLYNRDLGQTLPGKIGNFAGEAITTLPVGGLGLGGAKAAVGAGRLARLGAATVDALGKTGVQGAVVGAAQPVDNVRQPTTVADLVSGADPQGEDFATAKAKQVAIGAGTGAVANLGARAAGAGVEAVKNLPTLPFRKKAGAAVVDAVNDVATPQSQAAKDFIDESQQISQDTGVQFTPGQETGSKGLTMLEQKARQSQRTADETFAVDNKAAQALDDHITRIISNVSKNAATPEETGELVRTALNSKVKTLDTARRTQAETDYGAVRQAAGGQPIIDPQNLRTALSDIKSEFAGGATKTAKKFSRFADDVNGSDVGSVDKLLQLRRQMSRVAGGQESITGDGYDRKAAQAILAAIDNDLDASATKLGGTNVGDLLKTANANYRSASQQIDYVKLSPLGKLLGKDVVDGAGSDFNTIAPEKLLARLKTMQPSEVSTTRALMQDASPDAWQQAKRTILEDALNQARTTSVSKGANPLAMQPGEFSRALYGGSTPKALVKGEAWAKALFDPDELQQIQRAMGAVKRLGDMTGYNHSGTASQMEDTGFGSAALSAAKGNIGTALSKAGSALSSLFTSNRLAAAMADPEGRRMLLQLERLPPGATKARELTARLAALAPVVGGPGQAQDDEHQSGNE